ncbi:MAG: hypothetical protein WBA05_18695 [Gordonia sp. (in: high G+C Gram-positive bacteria)]|uniref:hypothetical protein n=1 Tax=Gordonia TaxID=2053 RepID=UPI0032632D9B
MNVREVTRSGAIVAVATMLACGVIACGGNGSSPSSAESSPVVTVTETIGPAAESGSRGGQPTVTVTAPPGVTSTSQDGGTSTSVEADLSQYFGEWTGHGRQMTLNPDGSAVITLADGATNVEKWTASWGPSGDGVVVTLGTLTWNVGRALGNHPGRSWTGRVEPSLEDGVTVLHMPGFTDWCSARFGRSIVCGA